MKKRKPVVAGQFYSSHAGRLYEVIENMVNLEKMKQNAVCVISPHAGYMYSGPVAGALYSSVNIPDRLIILGPDHRGAAKSFSVIKEGAWETPLGDILINTELAQAILQKTELVSNDFAAHAQEHSLEVQLPFIQYFNPRITMVPVICPYFAALNDLLELGKHIAETIKSFPEQIMLIASSDMSHQVSQETARRKDFLAIERIEALDASGLYETVRENDISMCGFQAVTAAIEASRILGADKVELIEYQNSGDVTGDYSNVVGYAGIRIS